LLSLIRDRIQILPGRLMLIVISMVSISRFFLEFLKEAQSDINLFYFNMGQALTIPILIISLLLLIILHGKKIKNLS
jgi:prolipoprotein diacylglyceryltransferase